MTSGQDRLICLIVFQVHDEYGLEFTRSKEKGEGACYEGGSACDVVGAAMSMGYSNVAKIWDNRGNLIPNYRKSQKK